jgi:hypothetical protein
MGYYTLEEALTKTNCFITRNELKEMNNLLDQSNKIDFNDDFSVANFLAQYFVDQNLFKVYAFQGEKVPMYSLVNFETKEVFAYAMPINDFCNLEELPTDGKFLNRDNGVVFRSGKYFLRSEDNMVLVDVPMYKD